MLTLFCIVIAKFIFVCGLFFSVLLIHLRNHVETLNQIVNIRESVILRYFITCRTFACITEKLISDLLFILMVLEQVILTTFSWLTINCVRILPMFLIVGASIAFICMLGFIITVLKVGLYIRLYSRQILRKKQGQYFGHNRLKCSYYYTAKWRAQKELHVSCGNCFVISKDAVTIFITVMNTNITNAVLLVIP